MFVLIAGAAADSFPVKEVVLSSAASWSTAEVAAGADILKKKYSYSGRTSCELKLDRYGLLVRDVAQKKLIVCD